MTTVKSQEDSHFEALCAVVEAAKRMRTTKEAATGFRRAAAQRQRQLEVYRAEAEADYRAAMTHLAAVEGRVELKPVAQGVAS